MKLIICASSILHVGEFNLENPLDRQARGTGFKFGGSRGRKESDFAAFFPPPYQIT
ncbi:hypothetical protein [Pararhodonellum marinum]|uniref:hypothetical protein n=1 Tax=Pararhodonellum marinum TaxID=2755358 RepID=UPI00189001A6|nr:hypothetical protein [Pararhodonellum marinum]